MINFAEAKRLEALYEELLREHTAAIAKLDASIADRKTKLTEKIPVKVDDTSDPILHKLEDIQKALEEIKAEETRQAELAASLPTKTQQYENSKKSFQDKLDKITVELAGLPDDDANRANRAKLNAEKAILERNQNTEKVAFEKIHTDLNTFKNEEPARKAWKAAYEKALLTANVQTLEAANEKEKNQKTLLESLKTELEKEKAAFDKLEDIAKLDQIQKEAKEKLKDLEDEAIKKKVNEFFKEQKLHNELKAFAHIQNITRADAKPKNGAQLSFEEGQTPPSNQAEFERFIKNLQQDHFFYDSKGRPLVEYVPGGDPLTGQSKPALVTTDDPRSPEVTAYTARAMGWTGVTIEKGTREERAELARYALQNEFEKINIRVTDANGRDSYHGTDEIWHKIFKARANLPTRDGADKQIFSKEAKSENTRLYSQLKTAYSGEAAELRRHMLSALTAEQLAKMAYDMRNEPADPTRKEFYEFLWKLFDTRPHSDIAKFFEETKEFIHTDNSANQLKNLLLAQHAPNELAKMLLSSDGPEQQSLYDALASEQRVALLRELTLPQLINSVTTGNVRISPDDLINPVTTRNIHISPDDLSKVLANKEASFVSDFWDKTKTLPIYNAPQGTALKRTVWAKFSLEKLVNIARSITNDAELVDFYNTLNKETRKQLLTNLDANILVKMSPAILSDKEVVREPKVRMLASLDANSLIEVAAKIHEDSQSHPEFLSMVGDAFFVKKQTESSATFNVAAEEFLQYTKRDKTIDYNDLKGKQLAIKLLAMLPAENLKEIFERDTNRAIQYYPLLDAEHHKEVLNKLQPETLAMIAENIINDNELGGDTKVSLLAKLSPEQLTEIASNVSGSARAEFYKLLPNVFFNKKDNKGAVDFNEAVTFLNNSDLEPQQKADLVARLLEQTLKANSNLPSWIKKQTLPDECKDIFKNLDAAEFHLLPLKLQQYAFANNCQPTTGIAPAV